MFHRRRWRAAAAGAAEKRMSYDGAASFVASCYCHLRSTSGHFGAGVIIIIRSSFSLNF